MRYTPNKIRQGSPLGLYGGFASAALLVALLAALLLASCPNPAQVPREGASGMGYFQLSLAESGRTIQPQAVQVNFAVYTLAFRSPGLAPINLSRTPANLNDPVLLPAGVWSLRVTAYLDLEKTLPAAQGELTGVTIQPGNTTTHYLELKPLPMDESADGVGVFSWDISFPAEIRRVEINLFAPGTSSLFDDPVDTITSVVAPGETRNAGQVELPVGYYAVEILLDIGTDRHSISRTEILHIYQNLVSSFAYTFTVDHFSVYAVTNGNNDGLGSLRYALSKSAPGSTIFVEDWVKTIVLEAPLEISDDITIDGNGSTITPNKTIMTVSNDSHLLMMYSGDVTIRRLCFKDGEADVCGGAICKDTGTLTLESCIFSGNRVNNTGSNNGGGAIYNGFGSLILMGCTLIYNSSGLNGGAIQDNGVLGDRLVLIGNLFYGNTIDSGTAPVILKINDTVTSYGQNVVDAPYGAGTNQAGWLFNGDMQENRLTVSPVSFRWLSGRKPANIQTNPSTFGYVYPDTDFYGNLIDYNISPFIGAAAGAVQGVAEGYYVQFIPASFSAGEAVLKNPEEVNADGCWANNSVLKLGVVTVDQTTHDFSHWEAGGSFISWDRNITYVITDHAELEAVFGEIRMVTNIDGSETISPYGSFRSILSLVNDWDIIRFDKNAMGSGAIEFYSPSSAAITISKNISIEGNMGCDGIQLSRDSTTPPPLNAIFFINSTVRVKISGVHFTNTVSSNVGAAIENYGNLTLESCIFSNLESTSSSALGGAIGNRGTLTVTGCTFYENRTDPTSTGTAIFNDNSGDLTLTGNLFYDSTLLLTQRIVRSAGPVRSGGYNVINSITTFPAPDDRDIFSLPTDVDLVYFGFGSNNAMPISGTSGSTAFSPEDLLRSHIPDGTAITMPATDFYGAVRTWPGAPGAVK